MQAMASFAYGTVLPAQKEMLIERRARIKRLTDALYDFLTVDCDETERALAASPSPMAIRIPSPEETLANAVDARNRTAEQLEEVENKLRDLPEPMRAGIEIACLMPLREMLRGQESYIQDLQKQIESQANVPR